MGDPGIEPASSAVLSQIDNVVVVRRCSTGLVSRLVSLIRGLALGLPRETARKGYVQRSKCGFSEFGLRNL